MQIVTFKLRPKQIFGAILALTGVIVIAVTFLSNTSEKETSAANYISCETDKERRAYIAGLGYEMAEEEAEEKEIAVPSEFNDVYKRYNEIQKEQGFDLEKYRGKAATVYTYKLTNYNEDENVVADLMVSDGKLIGADLCNPSADEGFLVALKRSK